MGLRSLWSVLALACLNCLILPVAQALPPSRSAAERLWQQGQEAVERGELVEAEKLYRDCLAADPSLVRGHLSLAAVFLGRDDLDGACRHRAAAVKNR